MTTSQTTKQQFIEKILKEFEDRSKIDTSYADGFRIGCYECDNGLDKMSIKDFFQSKLSECWDVAREEGKEQGYKNVGRWYKLPEYKEMTATKNIDGSGGLVNCGCSTCGGRPVTIRAAHPGLPDREICPTCTREVLESILNNCNNRAAQTDKSFLLINEKSKNTNT